MASWQLSFSDIVFLFPVIEDFCWRRDKFQLRVDGYKSLEAICFLQSSKHVWLLILGRIRIPDSLSVTLIQDHLFQQVFELFVFTSKFRQARFAKDLSWNCHLSLVLVNSENCVGEHFGAVLLMVHSGGPKKSWQIPHTATYTTVSLKLILSQPRQPTLFQTRIALNCKIKDKARNQHKIQAKVKHKSQLKSVDEFYLTTDIVLFIDLFESFRYFCWNYYGWDPVHCTCIT